MAWSASELVQRGHNFAIVDEVDSILIDEARTPADHLRPGRALGPLVRRVRALVGPAAARQGRRGRLRGRRGQAHRRVTERGVARVEDRLGIDNLYESVNTPLVGYLNNAIKAKELYKRDKDYIVTPEGEVLIVDEFTGRILHGRRYNEGMHQAIEAKEGVEVKQENQTLATDHAAELLPAVREARRHDRYGADRGRRVQQGLQGRRRVHPDPPPDDPIDHPDVIYKTEKAKFNAVIEDIAERHATGQPVLVGTVSVENSEILSQLLRRRGIPHSVLNAKFHAQEAHDHRAGRPQGRRSPWRPTWPAAAPTSCSAATPSSSPSAELHQRGLDPVESPEEYAKALEEVLPAWKEACDAEAGEVIAAGGLYVLGTERHDSRRIDNQLRGRSGRQGDPGESRFYLSLQDDLMKRFRAGRGRGGHGALQHPRGRADRVEDGDPADPQRADPDRGPERRDPQERPQVRRGAEQAAPGHLRRAQAGARRRGHARAGAHMIDDVVGDYVLAATSDGYAEDWDLEQLWTSLSGLYPVSITIDDIVEESGGERNAIDQEFLIQQLKDDAQAAYDAARRSSARRRSASSSARCCSR
jgi:preprotein translocase subunit SecA